VSTVVVRRRLLESADKCSDTDCYRRFATTVLSVSFQNEKLEAVLKMKRKATEEEEQISVSVIRMFNFCTLPLFSIQGCHEKTEKTSNVLKAGMLTAFSHLQDDLIYGALSAKVVKASPIARHDLDRALLTKVHGFQMTAVFKFVFFFHLM
jgi:hypothetical protein